MSRIKSIILFIHSTIGRCGKVRFVWFPLRRFRFPKWMKSSEEKSMRVFIVHRILQICIHFISEAQSRTQCIDMWITGGPAKTNTHVWVSDPSTRQYAFHHLSGLSGNVSNIIIESNRIKFQNTICRNYFHYIIRFFSESLTTSNLVE